MKQATLQEGSLGERILDAFPSGSYAVAGLLRLLDELGVDEHPGLYLALNGRRRNVRGLYDVE